MRKFQFAMALVMIVVLDLVAGILGIIAENVQNKMTHVKFLIFECKEASHKAYSLGLAAAVLLAFAHVIATLLGGCKCVCSPREIQRASRKKKLSAASLVLSWVILTVGILLLIIGALSNSKSRAHCRISHHKFLSIGGVLCFFHALVSLAFCITASEALIEAKRSTATGREDGAQMI
ncbi:DUF1218 domain-containing protein [Cinnamomum micranthum f. kanehirae]|uniref:DUF1218 domain-containing protein n=1 Tax=Cinnamomum micranthum f. kanehirae TaxID=337451 RepID=A0A3S3NNY9_9MAGN|nr:DUF1218 domain-containing protein [Cinnamomum micranthum f. kanehirae]